MDRGIERRGKERHGREKRESESRSGRKKQRGGREEFGEVEENVNLRKAAGREKLFSSLSPTPSLPVPAVNQSS
ncbi:hypothetical protein CesoFtcFv8_003734 [Champsocephalus esox]|uniref:Uncharacterized protein n=1 Tax=Champsocephalus esox TaxID=159716 RepID=A0AAN8CTB1_9TELE|nr:hypothetical protein CesoFtcFv8_003734 [Champsocephalus esox]